MLTILLAITLVAGDSWIVNLSKWDIFKSRGFTVSDSGHVFYIDDVESRVIELNKKGEMIHAFGKAGEGPGEFSYVHNINWIGSSQQIYLTDWPNQLHQFDMTGNFLSTSKAADTIDYPTFTSSEVAFFRKDIKGDPESKPTVVKWNLKEGIQQAFWQHPTLKTSHALINYEKRVRFKLPFHPTLLHHVGSDFVAVCYNNEDKVLILDQETGQQRRQFFAPFQKEPVTRGDWDEQLKTTISLEMQKVVKTLLTYDEMYWPGILSMIVDEQDHIWLFGREQLNVPWQVYDVSGKLLKKGALPHRPRFIKAGYFYYSYANEDGEILLEKAASPF